jgi:hypothetical protein
MIELKTKYLFIMNINISICCQIFVIIKVNVVDLWNMRVTKTIKRKQS